MNNLETIVTECFPGHIDFNTDLFEQGVSSLALLNLVDKVADTWSTDIDLEAFLCEPTIRHLDEIISNETIDSFVPANSNYVEMLEPDSSTDYEEEYRDLAVLDEQWNYWIDSDEFLATIDQEKDLFEYQIMSLRLLAIVDDFTSEFGVEVEIDEFLQNPTLSFLKGTLVRETNSPNQNGKGTAKTGDAKEKEQLPVQSDVSEGTQLSVLSSKEDKEAFIAKRVQQRLFDESVEFVLVPQMRIESFKHLYECRDTSNRRLDSKCESDDLLNWLQQLGSVNSGSKQQYLYPSAGGTYAVQTYIEVSDGRVSGLSGGAYYFDQFESKLIKLSDDQLGADAHFFYNKEYYEKSNFRVYFVAEMDAITPIYQGLSNEFVHVEAGCIAQHMASSQQKYGIRTRLLAGVNEPKLVKYLNLGESHKTLIGMAGYSV